MFRRWGTFWIACGTAIGVGYFLIVALDFIDQISFISGFSSLIWELSYLGHLLVVIFSFLIIILPLDFYFMVWGTTISRDPSFLVSLELLLFFGMIGAIIGFRSHTEKGAFIGGYLFVAVMNLILFVIMYLLSFVFIGTLLSALLQGISGRDLFTFFISSVLENGTVIAIFSLFIATLLGRGEEDAMQPELCLDQKVCPI